MGFRPFGLLDSRLDHFDVNHKRQHPYLLTPLVCPQSGLHQQVRHHVNKCEYIKQKKRLNLPLFL